MFVRDNERVTQIPFGFVAKVFQRRQGLVRVRDLLKANEVLHEIKQHEDISRTHRNVRCKSGRCRLSFRSVLSEAARGKFNVFECVSHTITRVCHSSMAAETRGLGLQVDSMQFFADLLSEILEVSAPSSKNLPLKQNGIAWPEMIATDARDVHHNLSDEEGDFRNKRR